MRMALAVILYISLSANIIDLKLKIWDFVLQPRLKLFWIIVSTKAQR